MTLREMIYEELRKEFGPKTFCSLVEETDNDDHIEAVAAALARKIQEVWYMK